MSEPKWRRELRPASFRGVPFEVFAHTREGGQRGPDHEYPQSSRAAPEDLGSRVNRFSFEAFVIGPDYHDQAARLIAALESGAGELVHPRWGAFRAICRTWTESESLDDGGMARFSLAFTRDQSDVSGLSAVATAADAVQVVRVSLKTEIKNRFAERFTVTGQQIAAGSVFDRALVDVAQQTKRVRAAVSSPLSGVLADIDSLLVVLDEIDDTSATLVNSPSTLADKLVEAVEAVTEVSILRVLTDDRAENKLDGTTPPSDLTELQVLSNADALANVVQRTALVELAARAVDFPFVSFEDAVELRDDIDDRVRVEEGLDDVSYAEYYLLVDLRIELINDLTEKAASLATVRTITVDRMTSALELAWQLYGDASRAEEIIDRNRTPHGGFMAPGEYKVLSE